MKRFFQSQITTTALAIFCMFFGAGNLIFPLKVGLLSGQKNYWAIAGFMATGVLLPLMGIIAMILFNGDYKAFFNRLGKIPGSLFLLGCMIIIGPLLAMPRMVTLSYIMVAPFIGNFPLHFFSLLFLAFTFLGTYKASRLVGLIGNIFSPLLLGSLLFIIFKGFLNPGIPTEALNVSNIKLLLLNAKMGYNTLDVLGAIFFSMIIISMLKKTLPDQSEKSLKKMALLGFKGGILGMTLLAAIYIGMSFLGVFHGLGLTHLNEGELFSTISFRILGAHGAILIALTVLMACYSTLIALASIVSEYVQKTILNHKVNYVTALSIVLLATAITSNFGLTKILAFSAPLIEIGYPVLIVLTLCNIAYKLWGFKPVKLPALITLIISIALAWWQ